MTQPNELFRGFSAPPSIDTEKIGGSNNRKRRLLLWVGFIVLAGISLLLAYQVVYADRVFLGVKAQHLDLSAMSKESATRLLGASLGSYTGSPLVLEYEGRQWKLTPHDLGYRLDAPATVAGVLAVGRSGNPIERLLDQLGALSGGASVPLALEVESAKAERTLSAVAKEIDQPFRNASLKVERGELRELPAQAGRQLDRATAMESIRSRVASLSQEPITLPVIERPPTLLAADLGPAREQFAQMTSSPVTLHYVKQGWAWSSGPVAQRDEKRWTIDPATLKGLVAFQEESTGEKPRLVVVIDRGKAAEYAKTLAKEVNQEPRDAKFDWNNGNLRPIVTSLNKHTLDVEAFTTQLEAATKGQARTVELPVQVEKAPVAMEDMAKMGIKELIIERSTSYAGSAPERAHNVELGATLLHGVVVPPGAVFSFNKAVGEVSLKTGFKMGFSIVESSTVPDAGGGICQVSTTLFQSTFFSGYPILERWAHAYRINRYDAPFPGVDATVYDPQLDFKFRNDSDTYLLIQAHTEGQRITFSLYGTKPKWQVKIDEPVITNVRKADPMVIRETSPALAKGRQYWVETANDGMTVRVRRTVLEEGKEPRVGEFTSDYRPQRNVVVIGTGD